MLRILTVVGARPQFVKAAMVSKAIVEHNRAGRAPAIVEEIVHTGQHYDPSMSDIFFDEMGIPAPAVNLNVGSGPHGAMTARMLEGLEREIVSRRPDWVLVYGDTNSTLAGALAASKLHVPVAHVESGLRSFNRRMPEEINRVLTDHLSDLLLCPTTTALRNLAAEGIERGVHHVGDVMFDAALAFRDIAERSSNALKRFSLTAGGYCLATVHRAENTDSPSRLSEIVSALSEIARRECPVLFPVHPRTRAGLGESGVAIASAAVILTDPLPFLDMVMLERHARLILTDSGGVQKEAYFHGVPCVTLREETEWPETVSHGWNQMAGTDMKRIAEAVRNAGSGVVIEDYGTGAAAAKVIALIAVRGGPPLPAS